MNGRYTLVITGALLVLLLTAGTALAAGGAASTAPPVEALLRHGINLVALIALLFVALRSPVSDFLKFRRSQVADQLDSSWEAKTEAEAKYAELQGRLDNFEAEIERIMNTVRADAQNEQKRLLEQAEKSAAQLQTAAKRSIDEEVRRVRQALRAEAIDLAVQMAEDLLTQEIAASDQGRLASEYLTKMEEATAS